MYEPRPYRCTVGSTPAHLRTALEQAQVSKFHSIKSDAKRYGHAFTIRFDQVYFPEKCPVFNKPLNYFNRAGNDRDYSPSFDKLDPRLGYVPGNVQVISCRANRIKNNADTETLWRVFLFWKYFDDFEEHNEPIVVWPKLLQRHQRQRLRNLKSRSLRECKAFNLSFGDVYLPALCPVTSLPLDYTRTVRGDNSPSFERIDPNQGYILGNVIITSELANRVRQNATPDELLAVWKYMKHHDNVRSINKVLGLHRIEVDPFELLEA